VIAVFFDEDSKAYDALTLLKDLDLQGPADLQGAAVVTLVTDATRMYGYCSNGVMPSCASPSSHSNMLPLHSRLVRATTAWHPHVRRA
jgi:hypothetical protein